MIGRQAPGTRRRAVRRFLPAGGAPDPAARLMAAHARTFDFAARFLDPERRYAVVALYAFSRTLDDLVDEPAAAQCPARVADELHAWRGWLRGPRRAAAPREPLGARLAEAMAAYQVPPDYLCDLIEGLLSDLGPREVPDVPSLYRYCYQVAGTVGLAMAHVLGATSPAALGAAVDLGVAMQLTNILRDVGADCHRGRVYLPRDELARFASSRAHLERLIAAGAGPDERFRAVMRFQVARAHAYYGRGLAGIWLLPPECRLPILIAGRLYRRILRVIERHDYDTLRRRAATSPCEKAQESAIAWIVAGLWRRGEGPVPVEYQPREWEASGAVVRR